MDRMDTFNARSICNKLPEFEVFINIDYPDLVYVTGTWLCLIIPPAYSL